MGQETKKDIKQADKRLVDMMFFGLDYGIENIQINGKGSLVPFVVTEKEGQNKLDRFVTERLEDGLSEGLRFLENEKESRFGVIVYDGFLTVDGQKIDAVLVKGFDRHEEVGYLIGQRYKPKKILRSFGLIGNPAFIGNEEQVLK